MQDTRVISTGSLATSLQPGSWILTYQGRAERLGHFAPRLFSCGPVLELVIVSIVSIFLLCGSG